MDPVWVKALPCGFVRLWSVESLFLSIWSFFSSVERLMSWIDEASELLVQEVAPRLGLKPMPGGSIGPCPACGASHRGRSNVHPKTR